MPITVSTPTQGDAIGPGTIIQASTLSVLPVGHHWEAFVSLLPGGQELARAESFIEGQSVHLVVDALQPSPGVWNPYLVQQVAQPATGAEYTLTVRVISAQSTIVDTSPPIGVVWRPDPAGTAYVQSLAPSSPIQGGFTEADRTVLQQTSEAVYSGLPLTTTQGGVLQVGLDAILKGPPIDLLAESEAFLLSGRGSINRPSGSAGVYAYGCRWRIETAPAGLGKLDGQVVQYEQRILQLVLVKARLGGGEYAAQVDNSHLASGEMQWSIPFPVRVDYDVLPGVVIRFVWLLLLQ
jgi:hypothetical protein